MILSQYRGHLSLNYFFRISLEGKIVGNCGLGRIEKEDNTLWMGIN